jgi:XRE family transcriptional regulator, fatty acid utilization regulator
MNIAERLKIARNFIGYTLERAAEESGIGISSLSEFENEKREPKFSQLSKLAEVYRRTVDFFLSEEPILNKIMLWREKPVQDEEKNKTEAEFRLLCEQYKNLEVVNGELKHIKFPEPDIDKPEDFSFDDAESFALKVRTEFALGEIPSASLKTVLEEKYYVKIFHLPFTGSAISTFSPEFGYAVLLNTDSATKQWRRNFDLAHELFHLLTWKLFRTVSDTQTIIPNDREEKLANAFASGLLLPNDTVKSKVEKIRDSHGKLSLTAMDEIARVFGVSLDALLWRLRYIYNTPSEIIEKYIGLTKTTQILRPIRQSDSPDRLPERYCSLAIRALKEGKLSLMQFKKYMGISYREAEQYLTDEKDVTDEEISISIA